ncbi:cytochrome b6/f complex subunit VI [Synechococcus sp. NOUM97013]|nr:cytochrome b6/f complex subunit VI [Synechococcus sp. NOUM97013]
MLPFVTAMGVVIYLGLVGAGLVTAAIISFVLRGIKLI